MTLPTTAPKVLMKSKMFQKKTDKGPRQDEDVMEASWAYDAEKASDSEHNNVSAVSTRRKTMTKHHVVELAVSLASGR